jgi:hypothetical protein
MPLAASLRARLTGQLEALDALLAGATPEAIARKSPSGKWSAHDNVAHLARHHALFLDRVERMLAEDRPDLGRYKAEDDPDWPAWMALTTAELVRRLRGSRARLLERLDGLDDARLARIGLHPALGAMTIPDWVEFVALHEAHHLYVAMRRVRGVE